MTQIDEAMAARGTRLEPELLTYLETRIVSPRGPASPAAGSRHGWAHMAASRRILEIRTRAGWWRIASARSASPDRVLALIESFEGRGTGATDLIRTELGLPARRIQ